MSESRQTVEVVSEGGVLRIILSRREARNALSFEMLDELERSLDRAVGDRGARVLLLESSGDVFCAGMDLRAVALEESAVAERFSSALARIYRRLITLEIPLLCAVDGPVIGGGLGLVAAADLVWAGPGAKFQLSEARLGLVPALVSVVLARRLRPKRILGLALSALPLDARGALELGIADRLSHESAAGDARAEAARMIRDNSPKAMRATKRLLNEMISTTLEHDLEEARRAFAEAVRSADAKRGLESFRRKETPNWTEAHD
ncbi:MAG TPA: enoyl-CoA hydratase/isomerase family protein [Planctomycetota bacterium]|nr:enoyl-CoA hydratase/isomerase family protein [Planctomycetota bacterium]